jgi:hypothetical protein
LPGQPAAERAGRTRYAGRYGLRGRRGHANAETAADLDACPADSDTDARPADSVTNTRSANEYADARTDPRADVDPNSHARAHVGGNGLVSSQPGRHAIDSTNSYGFPRAGGLAEPAALDDRDANAADIPHTDAIGDTARIGEPRGDAGRAPKHVRRDQLAPRQCVPRHQCRWPAVRW